MGKAKKFEPGRFTCITEGCSRSARAKTKAGKCQSCQSTESYHRKNPDAPYRPIGFHGKWKGKKCECGKRVHSKGLCAGCYSKTFPPRKSTSRENRARRIKNRYGITLEQYEAMVIERDNRCDVCGQEPDSSNVRAHWNGKLCIDHCHDTGKVRGLLCNDCNLAVGYGKIPETLYKAAEYLRIHNGQN